VTIRPRRPEDLPPCVAVLAQVHRTDRYPEIWQDDAAGWLDPPGTVAAWVAGPAGQVSGHVSLIDEPPEGDGPLKLARLFVAPTAQGRGLARRLMTTAVSWAQAQGRDVVLEVDEQVPAVAVYERLGWRFLGSGPGGWIGVNGRQPVVRYYAAPGNAAPGNAVAPGTPRGSR
jgi:GNAT superfamily N-acetyltransferase